MKNAIVKLTSMITNEDYYSCSEEHADKITDDEIWQVKYCIGYNEC